MYDDDHGTGVGDEADALRHLSNRMIVSTRLASS